MCIELVQSFFKKSADDLKILQKDKCIEIDNNRLHKLHVVFSIGSSN